MAHNGNEQSYCTTDLELAAFLRARGSALLDSFRENNKTRFSLRASPADAMAYFHGQDTVSARALFSAWRSLRTLIEEQRRGR